MIRGGIYFLLFFMRVGRTEQNAQKPNAPPIEENIGIRYIKNKENKKAAMIKSNLVNFDGEDIPIKLAPRNTVEYVVRSKRLAIKKPRRPTSVDERIVPRYFSLESSKVKIAESEEIRNMVIIKYS